MHCPAVKGRLEGKIDNQRPSTQELLECFAQLSKGGWKKRGRTLLAIACPALLCMALVCVVPRYQSSAGLFDPATSHNVLTNSSVMTASRSNSKGIRTLSATACFRNFQFCATPTPIRAGSVTLAILPTATWEQSASTSSCNSILLASSFQPSCI